MCARMLTGNTYPLSLVNTIRLSVEREKENVSRQVGRFQRDVFGKYSLTNCTAPEMFKDA